MARISRKKLKQDRFQKEVGQSVEYVASHHKQFIVWLVIVTLLFAAGLVYWRSERSKSTTARHNLHKAINMFHAKVDTEERLGELTFPTSITKYNRTSEAFEKIAADFADRLEGHTAQYYLALLEIERGENNEARARLESLVSDVRKYEVSALARLAIAGLYAREGQDDKARSHYQHLIAQPSHLVPKQRSQLDFGRYLIEKSPKEAADILNQLLSQPGPWTVPAGTALRSMEGS